MSTEQTETKTTEDVLKAFADVPSQPPATSNVMPETDPNLSFEQRILAYLSKRKGQTVRINDFLKSLYPASKIPGLKPEWYQGHESKRLGRIIGKMAEDKIIEPINDLYKDLGTFYYEGEDPRTKYHNLNTVIVEVKVL